MEGFLGDTSGFAKEADACSTEPSLAKRISSRTCWPTKGYSEDSKANLNSVELSSGSNPELDGDGMWGGGVEDPYENFRFLLDINASILQSECGVQDC